MVHLPLKPALIRPPCLAQFFGDKGNGASLLQFLRQNIRIILVYCNLVLFLILPDDTAIILIRIEKFYSAGQPL